MLRPDRPRLSCSVPSRLVAHCVFAVRRHRSTPVMHSPHRPPDATRRSCLCRVSRCELDDCSGRVQTSKFPVGDSLGLSAGIQFTPPKRTRHRQDSFVVSGGRCGLGVSNPARRAVWPRWPKRQAISLLELRFLQDGVRKDHGLVNEIALMSPRTDRRQQCLCCTEEAAEKLRMDP